MTGVFFINSTTSAASVKDGLSNTAFVAEIVTVNGDDMRGRVALPRGPTLPSQLHAQFISIRRNSPGMLRKRAQAPCDGSLFNNSYSRQITMTARSVHPGGACLLLGDGSVHFVSDSINLRTWQALAHPAATNPCKPISSPRREG